MSKSWVFAGEFRRPGGGQGSALRGGFLSQRWERNQWPRPPSLAPSGQFTLRIAGDAADGLRLRSASPRSIGPLSPDPITGDALLVSSTSSPVRKNGVVGLNPCRATGPWVCKNCCQCGSTTAPGSAEPTVLGLLTAEGPRASPTQSRKSLLKTVGERLAPPAIFRNGLFSTVGAAPCGRPP